MTYEELLERIMDIALDPIKPIIEKLDYEREHPEEKKVLTIINSEEQ